MSRRRPASWPSSLCAALLACLLLPLSACPQASEPVEPVETCTVERQQAEGEVCRSCDYDMAADMQSCADRMMGSGLAFRCKTDGTHRWTEVWCGPASAVEPPARTTPP